MIIIDSQERIGPVLRGLRAKAGLTIRQLAELAHVSKSGITKRENRPGGTVELLIEHAAALGYAVALVPKDATVRRTRIAAVDFADEYELLRSDGLNRQQIADRLGMTRAAVDTAYVRALAAGLLTPDRRTA